LKRLNNRNRKRRIGSSLSVEDPAADHPVDMIEITERTEIIEVVMAAEIELLKREEIEEAPRSPQEMSLQGILGGEVKISMMLKMLKKLRPPHEKS
jgi:hypothetical protein